MDDIKQVKKVINRYNLHKYIKALVNHWCLHPPTLGHGFAHAIDTAVEAYNLGKLNKYSEPEELFIGGLFHDIYRPAEGKDGEEDQTHGAKYVKSIFKELNANQKLAKKVVSMIESHDNWRKKDKPPMFDLLISIADKAVFSPEQAYSYAWSSNKFAVSKGKPLPYASHLSNLLSFSKYQTRAWEIFNKYINYIRGIDKAISSYLLAYQAFANSLKVDPNNRRFSEIMASFATKYLRKEQEYLKEFDIAKKKAGKILQDSKGL